MDITLACTNNIVYNMPEVHDYICKYIKNNNNNLSETTVLYSNPIPYHDTPIISFNRDDVIPKNKSSYKHINRSNDNIAEKYNNLSENRKIINIVFPLDSDIYLGSIIVLSKNNNSNIYNINIISKSDEL